MDVKLGWSDLVTNFKSYGVLGPKIDPDNVSEFLDILEEAVKEHEESGEADPGGQYFLWLPERATEISQCGIGRRTMDPKDYVVRPWRGRMEAFLHRSCASEKADHMAAVVYTREAYMVNPDVVNNPERGGLVSEDCTHVVVFLLHFVGPKESPFNERALVHNLAGGNTAFLNLPIEVVRDMAAAAEKWSNEWSYVTDEWDESCST